MSEPETPKSVTCPVCGKPVPWTPASKWRPFCSERCRMVDLGGWLGERYRIPGEPAAPGQGGYRDEED